MTAPRKPFAASTAPPRVDPAYIAWNTVISYDNYASAQHAVDRPSDGGFPVEHLDIIGSDLRLVERVTGRLTTVRAATAGAASGAWFGLLIGLLLAIFTTGAWFGLLIVGAVIGTVWGAVFGFMGYAATRGTRDFASTRTLAALHYDIVARDGYVDAARSGSQLAGLLPAARLSAVKRRADPRWRTVLWAAAAVVVVAAVAGIDARVQAGSAHGSAGRSTDIATRVLTGPSGPEALVLERGQQLASASTAAQGHAIDGIADQVGSDTGKVTVFVNGVRYTGAPDST